MAQAAQHSIDTLQRIIDDKNEQLKRKEKIIDDLKRDLLKNKEEDCYEIQKLNEQIRELRSKGEITNLNQLMNKSTHKQFYPSGNSDDKLKSMVEMLEEKDEEMKKWQRKYNELYISTSSYNLGKSKAKGDNGQANKIVQSKLRELAEEREVEKKRFGEQENRMKQKVKNLQKLIKQKDVKLGQLHKALLQLKEDVINEKKELSEEAIKGNEQFIMNMNKGNSANDGKL